MISFPNCKINLGLRVLRKRNDGYHDLETVFYPLPFYDILEIVHAPGNGSFTGTGLPIAGEATNNLCVKAVELLKKDFPELPAIQMHLHKTIPMGAGLGGGSSDGAFTLQLLNQKFRLGLSKDQLLEYALRLGSDCPFFIINKPCFATGRGEQLEEIKVDLLDYRVMLMTPGIHVDTAKAFSETKPVIPSKSVKEIVRQPVTTWRNELVNDFEISVLKNHKEIREIKDFLYAKGAIYASMTGSGSSVFGIFPKDSVDGFSDISHWSQQRSYRSSLF